MSKTPEEYFQEQSFSLPQTSSGQAGGSGLSSAELAFIRKYMGLDASDTLRKLGLEQKAELAEKERASAEPAEKRGLAAASPVDSLILSFGEERPEIDVPRKLTDVLGSPPAPTAVKEAAPPVTPREELAAETAKTDAGQKAAEPVMEKAEAGQKLPEPAVEPPAVQAAAPGGRLDDEKAPRPEVTPVAPAPQPGAQPATQPPQTAPSRPEVKPAAPALQPEARTDQSAELKKLKSAKQTEPSPKAKPTMADIYDSMDIGDALEHFLRNEAELQMVAFYVGDQEFTVPTVIVQEVIHYSTPVKLPVAPPFVAGVINLRGKVTPLVYLRDILEVKQKTEREDRFIVICRYQGLQIGLIIEKVHSMYRVTQKDIDWGIEAHLGINVDYVSGLLKHDDHLIGIVAVDKIVTNLLSDGEK
jgi:purine-binding chemotaxis protein CheW